MASYEQHAQAASDLLASMKLEKVGSYEIRLHAAQIEALLALAAAIAGRQTGSSGQPPQWER
ncbi:hypothetical protein ACIGW8_35735 [Streptomyces sioyaensis]|uniref:hypothetical protein n=1 Tax=Streptomyces sioyaensis TaxID=67364 RepID=UPI0037D62B9D